MSKNVSNMFEAYISKATAIDKPELILTYGRPGSGKTHFAGGSLNVPGFKKGLYIDTEGSTVGVLKDERWDIIRVDKYPDMDRVKTLAKSRGVPAEKIVLEQERFLFLSTILGTGPNGIFNPANNLDYDVVVVDTFDIAQDWAQQYFLEGAGRVITRSGEVDGYAGWRNIAEWSNKIAHNMKKIEPLGLIVIHDKEEKGTSGAIQRLLRLSGSSKDTLPGIPDVVVYLDRVVEEDEYVTYGYFGTNDGKVTKDRFNFPPVVRNVTIPQLFKFIDNKEKK